MVCTKETVKSLGLNLWVDRGPGGTEPQVESVRGHQAISALTSLASFWSRASTRIRTTLGPVAVRSRKQSCRLRKNGRNRCHSENVRSQINLVPYTKRKHRYRISSGLEISFLLRSLPVQSPHTAIHRTRVRERVRLIYGSVVNNS
jgi:hypothetical protein